MYINDRACTVQRLDLQYIGTTGPCQQVVSVNQSNGLDHAVAPGNTQAIDTGSGSCTMNLAPRWLSRNIPTSRHRRERTRTSANRQTTTVSLNDLPPDCPASHVGDEPTLSRFSLLIQMIERIVHNHSLVYGHALPNAKVGRQPFARRRQDNITKNSHSGRNGSDNKGYGCNGYTQNHRKQHNKCKAQRGAHSSHIPPRTKMPNYILIRASTTKTRSS